jgi:hypothetical protein
MRSVVLSMCDASSGAFCIYAAPCATSKLACSAPAENNGGHLIPSRFKRRGSHHLKDRLMPRHREAARKRTCRELCHEGDIGCVTKYALENR